MSFDWLHYLVIAHEMFEQAADTAHEDANLRCSISRAYYAVFHQARHKLIDKWSISISHSAVAHAQAQNSFKQKHEKAIAKKLKRMRDDRNKADYDDQIANLKKTAKNTLRLAKEVIEDLEKL